MPREGRRLRWRTCRNCDQAWLTLFCIRSAPRRTRYTLLLAARLIPEPGSAPVPPTSPYAELHAEAAFGTRSSA
jgi:hypothetical protein